MKVVVLRAVLALGLLVSTSGWTHALVVGNVPGSVPVTTGAPADDPGWANLSSANIANTMGNYIYLGDGWVLSARHVDYYDTNGVQFGNMNYKRIGGEAATSASYNSYYNDYGFNWFDGARANGSGGFGKSVHASAVSNVANNSGLPGVPQSLGLSPYSDLQLFRINGAPELDGVPDVKGITIATQKFDIPAGDFTSNPNGIPQVTTVGQGSVRAANETHWNVNTSNPSNWVWNETTTGPGDKQGYGSVGPRTKQWGTNRIGNANDHSDTFNSIISTTDGVIRLTGHQDDVILLTTNYDKDGTNGDTDFESQAVGGDSGSAVFYKRGTQWELVGVINAVLSYDHQPGGTAVYGNSTLFADLWYYNQDYMNSISDIIADHPNYSSIGDVNLDGIVSGNGTGLSSTDDVTAFIAGWGTNEAVGNINTWKKGDMNRDGKTNVADFILLRDSLNTPISGAALQSLFGESGGPGKGSVPEPASVVSALLAAGFFAAAGRRSRHVV